MALYESILASPYRTMNGDEADFFYVPVLDSCIITRADDAPHLRMKVWIHLWNLIIAPLLIYIVSSNEQILQCKMLHVFL